MSDNPYSCKGEIIVWYINSQYTHNLILCTLILLRLVLYKSCTYLLTYLLTVQLII